MEYSRTMTPQWIDMAAARDAIEAARAAAPAAPPRS